MTRIGTSTKALVIGGLIVALSLAFFASRFASSSPDGLNKMAIDKGFDDTETEHAQADSPLAGYAVRGVDDEGLSTGLAGVIGVTMTFGIALLIFGFANRKEGAAGRGAASAPSGTAT